MATNGEFRTIRIAAQRAVGALVVLLAASTAWAQGAAQPSVEIYGFGKADAIADFKQNNPDWYDVNRPSGCRIARTSSARTATSISARARAASA